MQRESLIPVLSEKRHKYLLIVYLVATLCFSDAALAQSGRRQNKSVSSPPPTVTAEPVVNPQPIKPLVRVSSIIVGGEIVHDYDYFRSSYLGTAIKECMNRLKERSRPALEITKGGSMTFNEAKDRAKKEIDAYVLWLAFVTKDNGWGEMSICYIDYAVLMPQTAKFLTSGQVYPGEQGVVSRGGVPRIPSLPRRLSALSQMKAGAREVADRLRGGGWL